MITNQFADEGLIFENIFGSGGHDVGLARRDYDYISGGNGTYVVGLRSGYEAGVRWSFIDPITGDPRGVDRVTVKLAAGHNYTDMKAYDGNGNLLATEKAPLVGSANPRITIAASGIQTIEYNGTIWPPAITEVSWEYDLPPTATLIFREGNGLVNTFWGPLIADGVIPGWDHVGLHVDNKVYEAHPGYDAGTYVSANGNESEIIPHEATVQSFHTRNTFIHNAIKDKPTGTSGHLEIELDYAIGKQLEQKILEVHGARYVDINPSSFSAANQKGANGKFTCVGLVEWAAESTGLNNSQGFVPNRFEGWSTGNGNWPLLTPYKMAYWINFREKSPELMMLLENGEDENYIYGFADPVDFLITDSLGRRLGYTQLTGELNEIPLAFYSGDGEVEQFFIPMTLPGEYKVDLIGLGDRAVVELATGQGNTVLVDQLMVDGETSSRTFSQSVSENTKGDVNVDGELNDSDVTALLLLVGQAVSIKHPGDLDGDASISETDVELLKELVEYMEPELTCAGLTPTITGTAGDDVIYGTEGDDVIKALAGNDAVFGLGGNDTICGGAGDDELHGGEGDDHIRGNRGSDRISGNKGNDTLRGGRGDDHLLGGKGMDKLLGRRGSDNVIGGKGFDICRGGKGVDTAQRCEEVHSAH